VEEAANALAGTAALPDPQRLGDWMQNWLEDGVLRLQEQHMENQAVAPVQYSSNAIKM
jgi:hypothetical protein